MGVEKGSFRRIRHDVDFCVIGGGMAGLCSAIAAARRGANVVLIHDRPVLGGNASSECRVHICGADRHNTIPNMRETGILEELRLENLHRNGQRSFSVWDTILYEKARYQGNLELLLNCSAVAAETAGRNITSVTGWQMTTQTWHEVRAAIFADCSGDAVLAPLTGAAWRAGREARSEYNEPAAPEKPDELTMGMSILFQTRLHETPQPFAPPAWAQRFESCEDLPGGEDAHRFWEMGYWWVELGGRRDAIGDTEEIRDELLKIAYGVWDHIKNRCRHRDDAENWALDWVQFLPAKRESRRYVGQHVLTQLDIESQGRFDDVVAYGGWHMDDHHPDGFWSVKVPAPPAIFNPAPSPYGIPYRSLCSRDIDNLMFAGRCASATHMAMSSTRVMGTCCSMGQAVGTAAAMAAGSGLTPRQISSRIPELQQALLRDDAYIPWTPQRFGPLTAAAGLTASRGDPEPLRDGVNRPVGKDDHCWCCRGGDSAEYIFDRPGKVEQVTVIGDSALDRNIQMSYQVPAETQLTAPPAVMPEAFHIDGFIDGDWRQLAAVTDNHQRLIRVPLDGTLAGVRFTLDKTRGADESRLYAFYVD